MSQEQNDSGCDSQIDQSVVHNYKYVVFLEVKPTFPIGGMKVTTPVGVYSTEDNAKKQLEWLEKNNTSVPGMRPFYSVMRTIEDEFGEAVEWDRVI
jgi:hypothetical protein